MEGRPLEDEELVERAKARDLDAYEEIVRRYQGLLVRAAYLVTGSTDEAEDAAQEAFVKAYRAIGRFRRGAPLRPWLLRIVTNEARNRRRSSSRRSGLQIRVAEDRRLSGDAAPSPETAAVERERNDRLLAAVNGLGEGERLAVAYRFFLGLDEEETAKALGVARGTVKSRCSRALGRLRSELADLDVAHEGTAP
ncbi:MAG: sigma-70 family RNA polymerase sigma factor [Actinomycetota bacterium]